MKGIIKGLNKAFDHRVRLGIMSILVVNDWVDFKTIKQMLELTDGNLASHIAALEKAAYIEVRKSFIGKRPNTAFRVSKKGKKAFGEHLDALEAILKNRR